MNYEPDINIGGLFDAELARRSAEGATTRSGLFGQAKRDELSFRLLREWRYHVVPVIPPGVELSPKSLVYKALRKGQDPRGKTPGRHYGNGQWGGISNWQKVIFTEKDFAEFENTGAGIGIVADRDLVAIDADILIESYATKVRAEIERRFGLVPMRVGQAPKAIYLIRSAEPIHYTDVHFGPKAPDSKDPTKQRQLNHVEFLANGKHFVTKGIHPKTREPYKWIRPLIPHDDLPVFSLEKISDFVEWLKKNLPDASTTKMRGATTGTVSPEDLKGDLALIKEAVGLTPNGGENFRGRSKYIAYGQALKGALQDHPEEAKELFVEFCERWEEGTSEVGSPQREWDKMRESQKIGAKHIFRMAHEATDGVFDYQKAITENNARLYFEPPLDDGLGAVGGFGEMPNADVGVQAPASMKPASRNEPCSDLGNARRLVRRYGSAIRYVYAWRKWAVWNGGRWRIDENGAVTRFAKQTVEAMHDDAKAVSDDTARAGLRRHALNSQSAARIDAMVRLAESEPEVVAHPRDFDADPWLLGVRNGVLELKTGVFREARRDDFITKSADADFVREALCPTWLEFLDTVTGGDRDLAAYLQRLVGYVLTGTCVEEVMAVLWGSGRNGKSTFRETVHDLMGDYAIGADAGLLTSRQTSGGATPDVARLHGRRLVSINETTQNDRLNEARVKFITSNDRITARNLYSEPFDFRPTHKTFLTTNHKPVVTGTDTGTWRRVHLVPFTVQIPEEKIERDFRMRRLAPEMSGILNWALEGLAAYRRQGLDPPPIVLQATNDYRQDMDALGQWLEERCEVDHTSIIPVGDLYADYAQWSSRNHGYTMKAARFGRELSDRGFESERQGKARQRCIKGIRLVLVGFFEEPGGGQ